MIIWRDGAMREPLLCPIAPKVPKFETQIECMHGLRASGLYDRPSSLSGVPIIWVMAFSEFTSVWTSAWVTRCGLSTKIVVKECGER